MAEGGELFTVTIVTPHGTRQEYNVRHLRAPGVEGDFGVLKHHLPFMTALRIGELHFDTDRGPKTWATSGGFVEVLGDQVSILAETAESSAGIDLERARFAKERAEQRLSQRSAELDIPRARAALARALNRIRVVSQTGSGT